MKKINLKNNSGQSVVELLIAMVVLTLILTSATLLTTKSIQLSETVRNREKAIATVKKEMELIRKTRDVDMTWSAFSQTRSEQRNEGSFTINKNYQGQDLDSDGANDRVTVTLTVSWVDFKGNHSIEQVTDFTKWK